MKFRNMLIINISLSILISITTSLYIIVTTDSSTGFYIYNEGWNGYSKLYSEYKAVPIYTSIKDVPLNNNEITIVIPVYRNFTYSEKHYLKKLLEQGYAIILLADIDDSINDVLKYLDLKIFINTSEIISDPINNIGDLNIIYAKYSNSSVNILLDIASTINVTQAEHNYSVIIRTYNSSYIDLDGSETLDPGEPYGSMIVGLAIPLYKGKLIVISDPDVFINAALDYQGNKYFADHILKGMVYIDQTHIPLTTGDKYKLVIRNTLGYITHSIPYIIIFITMLLVIFNILSFSRGWRY